MRHPRELRDNVQKIREVVIPSIDGTPIPLGQVAADQLTLPTGYTLLWSGQIEKRPQAVARSAQTADTIKAVAETTV